MNEGLLEICETGGCRYMQTGGHGNCDHPAGDCDDHCNTCTGKTIGGFEKVYIYEKERWEAEFDHVVYYTHADIRETIDHLKSAHNADISAKDKRIAELEAVVADLTDELKKELNGVISLPCRYVPECTTSKEYAVKRLAELMEGGK